MGLGTGTLPVQATHNDAALLAFLQPYLLHSLPNNLRYQTYFYLVFKFFLFSIAIVFITILIRQGKFWLFRVVKVSRGTIICPNACEVLLTFAGIYYICDAVYRGLTLRWFWDQGSEQTGLLLFSGLRLVPLWIAGFVHVSSVGLLWPLTPSQLHPRIWHCFLFGLPIAFLVAMTPANALSSYSLDQANQVYQTLREQMLSDPNGMVSSSEMDLVNIFGSHLLQAYKMTRIWALIGAAFIAILLLVTLGTGPVLIYKIYTELAWLRYKEADGSINSEAHSAQYRHHADKPHTHTTTADGDKAKQSGRTGWSGTMMSVVDMLRYKPEVFSATQRLQGIPTGKSRIAILSDFLFFTTAQVACLIALECSILAIVLYLATNVVSDVDDVSIIPTFHNKLQRTCYIYHVVEIWSVIIFGTPLVVLMLYRQCFPMKVEVKEAVQSRKSKVVAASTPASPLDRNTDRLAPVSPGAQATEGLWSSPSTFDDGSFQPRPASVSDDDQQQQRSPSKKHLSITDNFRLSREAKKGGVGGSESSNVADRPASSGSSSPTNSVQDVCGYIGPGAAKSIVLQALDRANQYPHTRRRRAAPWHVTQSESTFQGDDVEMNGGSKLYATPHGAVEGAPLSYLTHTNEEGGHASTIETQSSPDSKRAKRPYTAESRESIRSKGRNRTSLIAG